MHGRSPGTPCEADVPPGSYADAPDTDAKARSLLSELAVPSSSVLPFRLQVSELIFIIITFLFCFQIIPL